MWLILLHSLIEIKKISYFKMNKFIVWIFFLPQDNCTLKMPRTRN